MSLKLTVTVVIEDDAQRIGEAVIALRAAVAAELGVPYDDVYVQAIETDGPQ